MSQTPSIALTGATGFLGGHVARQLIATGARVRALVRDLDRAKWLADLGGELILGDLNASSAMEKLLQNTDCVVHIAGAIKAKTTADLIAINGGGTQKLVDVCARISPDIRFVHISSITAREENLSPYAISKAASEHAAKTHQGPLAIVRPNAVYGPGDRETLAVFQMAGGWLHPVLHRPDARIAMIHGADAAAAIVALCQQNAPTGLFEISDARTDGYSWSEITQNAVLAVGGKCRPVPIPAGLMQIAGSVSGFIGKFQKEPPIFNAGKVAEMLHGDWSVQNQCQVPPKIWTPNIPLAQGFNETVAWYRDQGWLQ